MHLQEVAIPLLKGLQTFSIYISMYFLLLRCGDDLIALYHLMGVQRYLGGTSVQHDKPIHQPGTLRKVSIYCSCIDTIIILQHVGSSELGSIVLNAPDLDNTTSLYDLNDFTLLLPPGITLSTIGHFAKAFVGADGKVINLCDHVVYTVEKRYSVSCNTCLQLFI